MSSTSISGWNWEWPSVGPSPVHHGLDSEVFDRTDFPYTDTFVREAIQNSLDARHDQTKPVTISFHFHSDRISSRRAFLEQVIQHRITAKLEVPDEWRNDQVRWLVVEDFNSKGLSGSLESRTSDFWGYWLNFGVTNKTGTGRGAHGIGRVTFLIASQVQSVIGYTRRAEDAKVASCGMAVLRAEVIEGKLRSTHAYLAEATFGDIYKLYESPEFQSQLQGAFSFTGYDSDYRSGLGLAILYPHDDLNANGILAAAIEHFSPAIMDNDLVVEVNQRRLDCFSIDRVACDVASSFNDIAIKEDVSGYLKLVRQAISPQRALCTIKLTSPTRMKLRQWGKDNRTLIENLREKIEVSPVILDVAFPLTLNKKIVNVSLRSIVGACPPGQKPLDLFFRRGMCLPKVKEKNPRGLNIVILAFKDSTLAMYLNFCEGKAHLDLLGSKDVQQKLKEKGFDGGTGVKNLVRPLSSDLRELFLPDISEPNLRVFDRYFSKPRRENEGGGEKVQPPAPNPVSTQEFKISKLKENGVRIKAKSDFTDWPVNAIITLAYADGSNQPSWSPHDFKLESLKITSVGCERHIDKNVLTATNCGQETKICISGFDRNREVDVRIRTERNDDA